MCLEERITGVELDKDATDAPDVAGKTPAKVEDDFGSAVVTGRYNRRVIFVVERCRPKVNQPDFRVQ